MRSTPKRCVAVVAFAGLASAAAGQVDPGDIGLSIVDGRIVTFLIGEEESGGGSIAPTRLFIGELGVVEFEPAEPGDPGSGGPAVFQSILPGLSSFSTNTPGFDSGPGVFAPGAFVGFTVNNGLQVYAPQSDSLISASLAGSALGLDARGGFEAESLAIEFNDVTFQTNAAFNSFLPTLLGTPFVDGLGLPAFADGRFHRHWNFTILPVDDPGASSPAPLADAGVYVIELSMVTSQPGVAPSLPFFIVFPFGVAEDSAEFAAAVAHVESLIAPSAPAAPGCTLADLSDTPPGSGVFGQLDGNDISAFVASFLNGCPTP